MSARLAMSVGCPSGIGPEVSIAAAAREKDARIVLVGDAAAIEVAARGRRIDLKRIVVVQQAEEAWGLPRSRIAVWQPTGDLAARDRVFGAPTAKSGAAQLAWVDAACDLTRAGAADALVTGPVSKEAIARGGTPEAAAFLGHTEHLQRRLHAREVVMAFYSPALVVSLATTHIPLSRVPRAVTPAVVARATYWLARFLSRLLARTPRIAVAALNPHAGEGGLIGREEATRITPGIARARMRLHEAGVKADIEGPVPAESALRLAVAGRWDGVVTMYHDQGTIPLKLVAFSDTVNVSLGLPIVRTSVDHGTGYDRAGTWTADEGGMVAAVALARRLVIPNASARKSASRGASGRSPRRST